MAIIKTDGGYNALPISYKRGNPIPLDTTAVWYDKTELETYAQSGVTAYVGQILTLVDTTKNIATAYVIANTAGDLEEVGATPIGDTKSIVVDAETKTISLKGVTGLDFNKKDAEGKDVVDGEGNVVKVQYQPLMTENGLVWVIPSETTVEGLATLIAGLDERVTGLETKVGKAAEGENAATGLYKVIEDAVDAIEIPVTGIADGEKVLSLTDTKLATTLSIAKTKKADGKTYVQLIGKDNAVVSEFDAAEFVADGMLESVTKDTSTNEIVFKWNTSAGITETRIDIDDLVEVYTAGNGIDITDFAVSVKRDSTSEAFLSVGANGIKLSGVQGAIDLAKQAAINDADGKLANKANSADVYTQKELDEMFQGYASDVSDLAGTGRTTENVKGNADAIAAIKNGATIDSFADVEVALAGKQDKLKEGSYATESYVDGKVKALADGAVAAAQTQADKGVADAAAAKSVADTANSQANTNKAEIGVINTTLNGDNTAGEGSIERLGLIGRIAAVEEWKAEHDGEFTTLKNTSDNHGTRIGNLETDVSAVESEISQLWETVNDKAGTLDDVDDRLHTAESNIDDIDGRLSVVQNDLADVQETLPSLAAKEELEAETDRATKAEAALGERITSEVEGVQAQIVGWSSEVTALQGRMDTAEGEIDTLQEQIKMVSGAMHFKGVVTTDPTSADFSIEGYAIGDVVIYGNKEYVLAEIDVNDANQTGKVTKFVEFGDATGNASAITALDERVKELEDYDHAADHEATKNAAIAAANSYADGLAGNYATAAQGAKADTAVQTVEGTDGLTATKVGDKVTIGIDETHVFILCGGKANTAPATEG